MSDVLQKLASHDEVIESINAKLKDHDARFDRIISKLIEHDERFERIEEQMVTKTEFRKFVETQDAMMVILKRMDTEQASLTEWLRRTERIALDEKARNDIQDQRIEKLEFGIGVS